MDLIQINVSNKYNPSFQLKNAVTSAKVSVEYSANRVFTAIPFVSTILNSDTNRYEFNVKAEYSYLTE